MAGTDFSHLTNDELIKGIKALDLPDYIRSKAYGIDVRETLAQMTEMTIQLGVNMGLSPDEALKWAKKLQESVSQSEFDSWVATLLDGGPSIFMNTLSELQSTYPNGAPGVALVRETDPAKIYVWNGSSWEDFGDYQGIEIKDGTVTTEKLVDGVVTSEKVNFLESTKNLFDFKKSVYGKKIDGAGSILDVTSSDVPTYVTRIDSIEPGESYVMNTYGAYSFRDSDNNILYAEVASANKPVLSPTNSSHLYVSTPIVDGFIGIDRVQVEIGNVSTDFEPYKRFAYTPILGEDEVNLLKDEIVSDLTKDNGVDDNENYDYISYQAIFENKTDVAYINKPAYINATFDFGECKNEKCISLETSDGIPVPFQWEDEEDVNFEFQKNHGRYYDGSLKSGKIWTTLSNLSVGETKILNIKVSPKEISEHREVVLESVSDDYIRFTNSKTSLTFNKNSKYLLNSAIVNGETIRLIQNPTLRTGSNVSKPLRDTASQLNDLSVLGDGVIFKELVLDYTFTALQVNLVLKTRLFKNGTIRVSSIYKPLVDMSTTSINQMLNRLAVAPKGVTQQEVNSVIAMTWDNNFGMIIHANGDAPRGAGALPNLTSIAQINANQPAAGDMEFMSGWSQSTAQHYLANKPYLTTTEVNLEGTSLTLQDEIVTGMNKLSTTAVKENKYAVKTKILSLIKDEIRHYLEDFKALTGSTVDTHTPSVLGELALLDIDGEGELDEISSKFKTILSSTYGEITADSLWDSYFGEILRLDLSGRVFPIALTFYERYLSLNNEVEAEFYKNVIGSYAEMMCRAFEEYGYVGLIGSQGNNSNSNATGLRGLAMGIYVFGENYDARWLAAYESLKEHYKTFIKAENFITDGDTHSLSKWHYYHYAAYSMYEYNQAIALRDEQPLLSLTQYPNQAISAYGAPKEHMYTVSSARRGQPLTYYYTIYLLLKNGNASDYLQAKNMLEHIANQDKPSGGIKFPLDNFYNPSSSYLPNLSFSLQVMYEILQMLI